jgi:hypothetical protein
MKQLGDKLVNSPVCDSNACYELTADMIKDLRQDHIPPGGGEKLAWFPTAITMPHKGMIFPEPIKKTKITKGFDVKTGKEVSETKSTVVKDDNGEIFWGWTVVKAIPVSKDEQHKYPDPNNPGTYYKHRMDMDNLKRFGKLEFMDAAEELGMFEKDFKHED